MKKISLEKLLEKDFGNNILSIRDLLNLLIEKNKKKVKKSIFIEEI
jgi:hypothetical protein